MNKTELKRISKKIEEIDNRVEKFWNNPSWKNTPVLQVCFGKAFREACRTSEKSFNDQIKSIEKILKTKTDYVPFLEPWHGVGVYAQAFGCPYIWGGNSAPWTKNAIYSVEEAKRVKMPNWQNSEIMNMVIDSIRYFKKRVGDYIPISLTDTQSPLDTAMLIWETNSFFEACHDAAEVVHNLLDMVTYLIIEFSLVQIKEIGFNNARPGHNGVITRPLNRSSGIGLSDDFLTTVSPKFYAEFSRPYNERIAKALGGVVVHSCGIWGKGIIAEVLKTKGIMGVELAVNKGGRSSHDLTGNYTVGWDPNPNLPETIRDNFEGTGIPVKGRIGAEPLSLIEKIYHPNLIFVPQIMWVDDPIERDKNYDMLHQKIEEISK